MEISLGGNRREYDKRDYSHSSLGMATLYPDTYSVSVPTIYMQGKYGTCGAHAGAQLANVLFGITSSPKFLWKIIKSFDGYGLNDGTDMRSIFKALQNIGVCSLALMDDTLSDTIEAYSTMADITPFMLADAANHKIGPYGFIDNPTIAQLKQAVATYKAAIILVDCGDGFYTPSWANSDVNPLHVGNFVGHHFMVVTKYDWTLFDGPNSWSEKWGDQGFFHFNQDFQPHVLELGFATKKDTKYIFNNNLWFGMMNNADVHALQVRLNMPVEYQTGNFLWKTLMAVKSYQSANGIPSTGYVGVLTRASLNK